MHINRRSIVVIVLLLIAIGYYWWQHNADNKNKPSSFTNDRTEKNDSPPSQDQEENQSIEHLTKEAVVVPYVKQNGQLPAYYITKKEARSRGWNAAAGNLCKVLPGKAIGGDVFTNREKTLPDIKGRVWYEADLNYNCGRRNADRLLFSSDHLVYVTKDHYKTFQEK